MMQERSSTEEQSLASRLLGRTLADPNTGLPGVLYFRLIREWEERRVTRHGGHVRVVRIEVTGGAEHVRRSLPWRLCSEFRTSDLLASDGPERFYLLLSGRDAEQVDVVLARVRRVVEALDAQNPDAPLQIVIAADPERPSSQRDACAAPDQGQLDTPPGVPRFQKREESEPPTGP